MTGENDESRDVLLQLWLVCGTNWRFSKTTEYRFRLSYYSSDGPIHNNTCILFNQIFCETAILCIGMEGMTLLSCMMQ